MATDGEDSEQTELEGIDEEDIPPPVKPTSLKRFVKQQSDMNAGGDAVAELQHHLEFVAERIWLEASKHAEDDGRKTVQERDVQHAIDEFTEPHDLIKKTVEDLDWMKRNLERQVEQSIVYAKDRYDD